jgi:hypothetical protein
MAVRECGSDDDQQDLCEPDLGLDAQPLAGRTAPAVDGDGCRQQGIGRPFQMPTHCESHDRYERRDSQPERNPVGAGVGAEPNEVDWIGDRLCDAKAFGWIG